jgi:uncharacterized protein with HEPN domain
MPRDYKVFLEDILERDILIHQYFGADAQIVWDIVQNKLTPLEQAIRALLQ